ncbi:ABC transporter substrate-binding protein [Dactylosporangium sucinum]|uniref:Sugar ABC transporter substrate-binding protein n=1 Tax=Dactylosporangium sucinum TaxID=1424081 RepID=A0A917X708_9ACTN|nr:ABC transporter substrate-binding protein [Dactylosporangium sucinum]GGM83446.1 sugar ABC transporter substrate-binding protein [Dactylosporangium sucinum]
MVRRGRVAGVLCAALLLTGCNPADGSAKPYAGQSVEVAGTWTGAEQANFERVLRAFGTRTGAKVRYTSGGSDLDVLVAGRIRAGTPFDVAMIPQPGVIARYASTGAAKPITGEAEQAVRTHFSPQWQRFGSVGGRLYGVYFKAANKSVIWYRSDAFTAAGVTPPTTLDELTTVSQTLVDSGTTAMAVPGADGWPLTDWFENIYLQLAGAEAYDRLAARTVPWTDPTVVETLRIMGRYWASPRFLQGGPDGALQTTFTRSVADVFGRRPSAGMLYEGDFVTTEIAKLGLYRVGEGARYFAWPSVDGTAGAVVAGGDAAVAFTDRPVTMALMAYLASPDAATIMARSGGFLSVNVDLDPAVYPDATTRALAGSLLLAKTLRFDLSDLTPSAFGGGNGASMWRLLQEYLAAPATDPATVAQRLESAAAGAYRAA